MKCVVLVLSAILAVQMKYSSAAPSKEKMMAMFEKCRQKENLGPEILQTFKDKKLPESDDGKCLIACMFEETGVIKDGKFSKEGSTAFVDKIFSEQPEKLEKAKKLIDTCEEVASADGSRCDVAFKIAECAKKNGDSDSFHFHDK